MKARYVMFVTFVALISILAFSDGSDADNEVVFDGQLTANSSDMYRYDFVKDGLPLVLDSGVYELTVWNYNGPLYYNPPWMYTYYVTSGEVSSLVLDDLTTDFYIYDYTGNSNISAKIVAVDYLYSMELDPQTYKTDAIYIPSGEYTFKFSTDVVLESLIGHHGHYFNESEEDDVIVEEGYYCIRPNGSSNSDTIYYNMSPEIDIVQMDSSYNFSEGSTSTQYMWYKRDISLSAGSYYVSSWSDMRYVYFLESESDLEAKFIEDVIQKHLTEIPVEYHGRMNNIVLDQSAMITLYILSEDTGPQYRYIYRIGEAEYTDWGEPMYDVETESLYVSANSLVKVGAKYDSSKYLLYLLFGETVIPLPNNVLVEISVDVSTEYTLKATSLLSNSPDAFSCEYEIYIDGASEPDGLAVLFAVVSIGVCVLFFGLLLISGKKPKWKD